MLDWTRIDNEKSFQRLVNELFALELNRPGYLPSSPYIGPDGGWDGRFSDEYMGMTGLTCVQSKWTQQSGKAAIPYLKGEALKELEKAKANKADNLLFATNAELRIDTADQTGTLEAVNQGHLSTLHVYGREKLTLLLERYAWLEYKYFGIPQYPLFAPATDYAEASEPELDLADDFEERTSELDQIRNFATSGAGKLLLIHGPQGIGKSRFVIQAAIQLQQIIPTQWQAWFCRPLRQVGDAFQGELHTDKHYVLFLDNADIDEDLTKNLLRAVKHFPPGQIRLVLTCRSHNRHLVQDWIRSLRIDKVEEIRIPPLSEVASIRILNQASGGRLPEHPDRLVRELDFNPGVVIAYGKLISGKASPKEFFSVLHKSVLEGATVLGGSGFNADEEERLLTELSAITPLRLGDKEAIETIAGVVGKPANDINRAIKLLEEAGVLRIVGDTIRFRQDIYGSVFLGQTLDATDGAKRVTMLIERWFESRPEVLCENLGTAAQFSETEHIVDALQAHVRQVVGQASKSQIFERKHNLAWLRRIAHLTPIEAIDLLTIYLKVQKQSNDVGRDEYGPVLAKLTQQPKRFNEILNLLREMLVRGLPGTYSNYEPAALMRAAISPIQLGNLDEAIKRQEIFARWLDGGYADISAGELAIAVIREALGGSHEVTDSYRGTYTWGRKGLAYSPKLKTYRDLAMSIYRRLLFEGAPEIQAKAVNQYNDIGYDAPPNEAKLREEINEERTKILRCIEELLGKQALPFVVLAEIEAVLVRQWANNEVNPDLSEIARSLLLKIPQSPEYRVYKFYVGGHVIVDDLQAMFSNAPATIRWSWIVENHSAFDLDIAKSLSPSLHALAQKYASPESVLGYLQDLEKMLNDSRTSPIPLIEMWAKDNPQPLLHIVRDQKLFEIVPERFHDGFHSVAAANIADYVNNFAANLLKSQSVAASSVAHLMRMAREVKTPPDNLLSWAASLAPRLDAWGMRILLDHSYWYFDALDEAEKPRFLELLEKLLESYCREGFIDNLDLFIYRIKGAGLDADPRWLPLRDRLLNCLQDLPRLPSRGEHLLEQLLDDDLAKLLALIEHRLRKAQNTDEWFDAIPYGGFDFIAKLFDTYEKFYEFMESFVNWDQHGLISSLDRESMLRSVASLPEANSPKYLQRYVKERCEENTHESLVKAKSALAGVVLTIDTVELYLEFVAKAVATASSSLAIEALMTSVHSWSYSGTIGEVPKPLAQRKEALTKLIGSLAAGEVRSEATQLLESVNQMIESAKKHADEVLESR